MGKHLSKECVSFKNLILGLSVYCEIAEKSIEFGVEGTYKGYEIEFYIALTKEGRNYRLIEAFESEDIEEIYKDLKSKEFESVVNRVYEDLPLKRKEVIVLYNSLKSLETNLFNIRAKLLN